MIAMRINSNECVGCPKDIGCIGRSCPYVNVERFYCDKCGTEDKLYHFEGRELCADCLIKEFDIVNGSECYL